jgi:beta-lactamase class A
MTDFNVKLVSQQSFKVISTVGGLQMPAKLQDLIDVGINETDKKDKYVLMYDSATGVYKLVNPDEVLSAASTSEQTQPGLPSDFTNQLDIDLDNKIDLDAGNF